MKFFFDSFFRFFGFLAALLVFLMIISGFSYYFEDQSNNKFGFEEGDQNSENIILVYKLSGPILSVEPTISKITNIEIISPNTIKNTLTEINQINPKVIIFSINSPGGTVSASNEIYNILKDFKLNNEVDIFFHSNEILTSGAYWISQVSDGIFASYGSIIGSIGVKGPDWVFFDEPKSISSGIFGNSIETKKGIKVYSQNAGKSKDLMNPFRAPNKDELDHLQKMVQNIYNDFVNLVAKNRGIEVNILKNEIGGLIYNSKQAKNNFLIDEQISLSELIKKTIKINNFDSYQIVGNYKFNKSLIDQLLLNFGNNKIYEKKLDIKICNILNTTFVSIMNNSLIYC